MNEHELFGDARRAPDTLSVEPFLARWQAEQGILIDVRSPGEYENGHILGAHSVPLFSNDERAEVGTLYKQKGRTKAIDRGLEIVGSKLHPMVRAARQLARRDNTDTYRPIFLHCWRGGMRSNSVAWLFRTAGLQVTVLEGGYKAYRRSFADWMSQPWRIVVVGGFTGCGKTDVLHAMAQRGEQVLDLEALANHRGSAFGTMGAQPTNEQFSNMVHNALRQFSPDRIVYCEGESLTIGKISIPQEFYQPMQLSPLMLYSIPTEARLLRIVKDYGVLPMEELRAAFVRIQKRLGAERAKESLEHLDRGEIAEAAAIALQYYDKGYHKSITSKRYTEIIPMEMTLDDPEASATAIIATMEQRNITHTQEETNP